MGAPSSLGSQISRRSGKGPQDFGEQRHAKRRENRLFGQQHRHRHHRRHRLFQEDGGGLEEVGYDAGDWNHNRVAVRFPILLVVVVVVVVDEGWL